MRYLYLILWLLLGLLYWWIATKYCCNPAAVSLQGDDSSKAVPVVPAKTPCPLVGSYSFDWSSDEVKLSSGWDRVRDSIQDLIVGNKKLELTGMYYSAEENSNAEYANLGIARANALKNLFELGDDKINVESTESKDDNNNKDCSMDGVNMRVITVSEKIKETKDKTIIYFPYNSTQKLNDQEVESYLNDVADRVKSSGERIRLTGHTDGIGEADYNVVLGQNRANIIRDYLISRGVNASKIVSLSKGEDEPIDNNQTRTGRQNNRRTELQIIK